MKGVGARACANRDPCVSYSDMRASLRRPQLKGIDELAAKLEAAAVVENKYTEHTAVSIAQMHDALLKVCLARGVVSPVSRGAAPLMLPRPLRACGYVHPASCASATSTTWSSRSRPRTRLAWRNRTCATGTRPLTTTIVTGLARSIMWSSSRVCAASVRSSGVSDLRGRAPRGSGSVVVGRQAGRG